MHEFAAYTVIGGVLFNMAIFFYKLIQQQKERQEQQQPSEVMPFRRVNNEPEIPIIKTPPSSLNNLESPKKIQKRLPNVLHTPTFQNQSKKAFKIDQKHSLFAQNKERQVQQNDFSFSIESKDKKKKISFPEDDELNDKTRIKNKKKKSSEILNEKLQVNLEKPIKGDFSKPKLYQRPIFQERLQHQQHNMSFEAQNTSEEKVNQQDLENNQNQFIQEEELMNEQQFVEIKSRHTIKDINQPELIQKNTEIQNDKEIIQPIKESQKSSKTIHITKLNQDNNFIQSFKPTSQIGIQIVENKESEKLFEQPKKKIFETPAIEQKIEQKSFIKQFDFENKDDQKQIEKKSGLFSDNQNYNTPNPLFKQSISEININPEVTFSEGKPKQFNLKDQEQISKPNQPQQEFKISIFNQEQQNLKFETKDNQKSSQEVSQLKFDSGKAQNLKDSPVEPKQLFEFQSSLFSKSNEEQKTSSAEKKPPEIESNPKISLFGTDMKQPSLFSFGNLQSKSLQQEQKEQKNEEIKQNEKKQNLFNPIESIGMFGQSNKQDEPSKKEEKFSGLFSKKEDDKHFTGIFNEKNKNSESSINNSSSGLLVGVFSSAFNQPETNLKKIQSSSPLKLNLDELAQQKSDEKITLPAVPSLQINQSTQQTSLNLFSNELSKQQPKQQQTTQQQQQIVQKEEKPSTTYQVKLQQPYYILAIIIQFIWWFALIKQLIITGRINRVKQWKCFRAF